MILLNERITDLTWKYAEEQGSHTTILAEITSGGLGSSAGMTYDFYIEQYEVKNHKI